MSDINLQKLYNQGYEEASREKISNVKGSYIPIPVNENNYKHSLFCDLYEEVKDTYTGIINDIDTFISRDNTNFTIPAELNILGKDIEYSYDNYKEMHDTILGTQYESNYSSDAQKAYLFETYHSGYATDSNTLIPLRADLAVVSRCLNTYDEWKDVSNPNVLQPIYNNTYWKNMYSKSYNDLSKNIQSSINRKLGTNKSGDINTQLFASLHDDMMGWVKTTTGEPIDTSGRRLGNSGNYNSRDEQIHDERTKRAMQWLLDNKLPINTVRDLITGKMRYYNSLLINTISQRANVASYYLTYVPNQIARYMHEAQNYILKPFYEYVNKLPQMPNEVDELLNKLIDEAERTTGITIQSGIDVLKLSKIEEDICKKRMDFMIEVNEIYNINSILESIENVKLI